MKVRCIKLLDVFGREIASSPWKRIGDIYDVLSLTVQQGEQGQVFVRLIGGNEPGPSLHSLDQFEIVDQTIPECWGIYPTPRDNGLFIGPAAWAKFGFWEKYFDGDPAAERAFQEERAKIIDGSAVKVTR
jgi:hypothetical protein